ncbi:MAG: histone deacetylase [Candidatus Bathyarchaeota archaeon]
MKMKPAAIVYHRCISEYDFGQRHPFRAERFAKFMELIEKQGLLMRPGISLVEPEAAGDDLLLLAHSERYLKEVYRKSLKGLPLALDTPLNKEIEEAARFIVGTSVKAGEIVANGKVKVAEGVGGGLHHAGRDYGGGFCVYNDVAVCVLNLLERCDLERVMILDSDVHAGNGTMDIFYQDPRVLFVSVHQDPRTFYPGTGFAHQIGEGAGEGYTVNVPLPPRAGDECMHLFLKEIFIPLAKEFEPQIIIRNGGTDPHFMDDLGGLNLTFQGLWEIGRTVAETAQAVSCGVVDLCCSGYNPLTVAQGWVSLLYGVIGENNPSVDHKDPPPASEVVLKETQRIIYSLRKSLSRHWNVLKV